jgi:WD40 repeat protein
MNWSSGRSSVVALCVLALAAPLQAQSPPAQATGPAPALVLRGHSGDLAGAAFSPDGTKVVTASSDKTARIWDAKTGAQLALLSGHGEVCAAPSSAPTASAS